jgi:hypothetical protein
MPARRDAAISLVVLLPGEPMHDDDTITILSFFKQIVGLVLETISRSWQTAEYLQSCVSLAALFAI